jgi:hypothetical protein
MSRERKIRRNVSLSLLPYSSSFCDVLHTAGTKKKTKTLCPMGEKKLKSALSFLSSSSLFLY